MQESIDLSRVGCGKLTRAVGVIHLVINVDSLRTRGLRGTQDHMAAPVSKSGDRKRAKPHHASLTPLKHGTSEGVQHSREATVKMKGQPRIIAVCES